ncbi:MAG: PEP-CTERM sorting domain-containing protein [Cuspidothrix sp.]
MFNFKSQLLGVAAVLPVVAAGLLSSVGSAQAGQLTGSIGLNGTAGSFSTGTNPGSTQFKFVDVDGIEPTGDFFPALISSTSPVPGITINNLTLTKVADVPVLGSQYAKYTTNALSPWIDFGTRTLGSVTAALTFDLDATQFLRNRVGPNGVQIATLDGLTGKFNFNGVTTVATGFLSGSRSGTTSGYEITLTADPTPVPEPTTMLGLGLVAAGMTVARRRKAVTA